LPPYVVTTGAPSFSASASSSARASPRTTPPPATTTGFRASSSRRATDSTDPGSGRTASGHGTIVATGGVDARARSTSSGTRTHTGPNGAVAATSHARATASAIPAAFATVSLCFTGTVASRTPIASTAADPLSSPTTPGASSGVTSPVTRAWPSAVNAGSGQSTYRSPDRPIASNGPSTNGPNTVRAPSAASASASTSPPVRSLTGTSPSRSAPPATPGRRRRARRRPT
jgi:hypothetical protein